MHVNSMPYKDQFINQALVELKKLGVTARPKKSKPLTKEKPKGKVFKIRLGILPSEIVTVTNGDVIVPKVVVHLCTLILVHVDTEGLFRKEGNKTRLAGMKETLDNGRNLEESENVLDVAALLKILFRELPESLIPMSHHEVFFQSFALKENEDKLKALHLACLLLPREHLDTLTYLMQFLQKVSSHVDKNKMNPYNIAVCIGPSLFRVEAKSAADTQIKLGTANSIIEKLITMAATVGNVPLCVMQNVNLPPDKTKRKSIRTNHVPRMFTELKKMVGGTSGEGNDNVVIPDLLLTPVTKKRKTQANGISIRKKKELLNKLPENVLLNTPFTPCRTPVSMDLSWTNEKQHLKDSNDLRKEKKSHWFMRSKSVKNLKNEDADVKSNIKNGLQRRWSAICQPNNTKKTKKRNSFTAMLSRKEVNSDVNENEINSPEPDYIRVPKEEYEAIKNRVSAMERRISIELETVQSLIKTEKETTEKETDSNVVNVQTVYEQTLVQSERLSPRTDQLAKRLSRELKIRRSSEQKIIRSPSARKIGSMRRKSKEFEKNNSKISRHQSWHAPQSESIPRVTLKRGQPNTVYTGLPTCKFDGGTLQTSKEIQRTRSSSVGDEAVKSLCCNSSSSSNTWVSGEGFFASANSNTQSSSVTGRASVAKIRSQNAGMVLAKAKLFDKLKESSDNSSSLVRSIPRARVGTKIGCARNADARLSNRVKSLKCEEKKLMKKSISPRGRNGCLTQKQKLQVVKQHFNSSTENTDKENVPEKLNSVDNNLVVPLKDCNREHDVPSICVTPKMVQPHIKKSLNVRSPRRLCRTPGGVERSTPLRVLKTPLYSHV